MRQFRSILFQARSRNWGCGVCACFARAVSNKIILLLTLLFFFSYEWEHGAFFVPFKNIRAGRWMSFRTWWNWDGSTRTSINISMGAKPCASITLGDTNTIALRVYCTKIVHAEHTWTCSHEKLVKAISVQLPSCPGAHMSKYAFRAYEQYSAYLSLGQYAPVITAG